MIEPWCPENRFPDRILKLVLHRVLHNTLRQHLDSSPAIPPEAGPARRVAQHLRLAP